MGSEWKLYVPTSLFVWKLTSSHYRQPASEEVSKRRKYNFLHKIVWFLSDQTRCYVNTVVRFWWCIRMPLGEIKKIVASLSQVKHPSRWLQAGLLLWHAAVPWEETNTHARYSPTFISEQRNSTKTDPLPDTFNSHCHIKALCCCQADCVLQA